MSCFPHKTFTLAEFWSLGYLFRISIHFTAIQHLAVPAMASTSGIEWRPVRAQQTRVPLDGCIRFTAYVQVICQQACLESYKQVLSRAYSCRKKSLTKKVGACRLHFPFPVRSPNKGDLGKDVTLSLQSYPELHRGLRELTSSCTEKKQMLMFLCFFVLRQAKANSCQSWDHARQHPCRQPRARHVCLSKRK